MSVQGAKYWIKRASDDTKRDWSYGGKDWIEDYWLSREHPHRQLIICEIEKLLPVENVLEVGCNCCPNLGLIYEKYKDIKLYGIDVNKESIELGRKLLPEAHLQVASVCRIPFEIKSFDVVLLDAVLLYIDSLLIRKAMEEITRVCRGAIILVEWYDKSLLGRIKDFHWARNYVALLQEYGFIVERIPFTTETWNTKTWIKNGSIFIARRR